MIASLLLFSGGRGKATGVRLGLLRGDAEGFPPFHDYSASFGNISNNLRVEELKRTLPNINTFHFRGEEAGTLRWGSDLPRDTSGSVAASRTLDSHAFCSHFLGLRIGTSGIPSPGSGNKLPTPVSVVSGLRECDLCRIPNTLLPSGASLPTSTRRGCLGQSAQGSMSRGWD